MTESDLSAFAPVPLRSRRDGWTAGRQRLFIEALGDGLGPARAARLLGMTRQTAYALRHRPGSAAFADAWDAAVEGARQRRLAALPPRAAGWQRIIEGVPRPVRYRGHIVAVERRDDISGLIRLLDRACRLIENDCAEGAEYFSGD